MKSLLAFSIAAIIVYAHAQTSDNDVSFRSYPQNLTVQQQLESLNRYWKDKKLDEPVLLKKIPLRGDVPLIRMHLSLVEKTLREKEMPALSAEQKANRSHCLDILHDYWTKGVFPINTHHTVRTPYFIDDFGTHCAVGQLMVSTGFGSVAKKIHNENNYAYVSELNVKYPELKLWADAYGFEVDELAWIQPGYCFTGVCPPQTQRNISCYGGYDGCVGYPDVTGMGTPPYTYIGQAWDGSRWVPPPMFSNGLCDLPAGLYRYLVIDAVGDSFSLEYTLIQPDSITLSLSSTDDDGGCHGSAYASASGGTPPYDYLWSRGDTTPQLDDACYGTYSVTVTDANGCMKSGSIIVATRSAPAVVTHGPIIGGVTDVSVRVFVRAATTDPVTLEFSTDNFATIAKSFTGQTVPSRDSSNTFTIGGLSPKTQYAVRVRVGGQEAGERAAFRTFPAEGEAGYYKYFFGSCLYDLEGSDTTMFARMRDENGDLFIVTGDWGYPDAATGTNDLYLSNPPKSWASDYSKVAASYQRRYASTNSGFLYRSIPMDYVYDDHDYLNDNTGRNVAETFAINLLDITKTTPTTVSQPPQARLNCIKGYQEFFPGYPLVDSTEGIFHRFTMGNVEFFVLDLRSARTSSHDALKQVNGEWVIQEPPGHSILGATQEAWLLNGLLNSTADWKIIVSSVPFNYGYGEVMDSLLRLGFGQTDVLSFDVGGFVIQGTGILAAASMSDSWNGFRTSRQTLLDFVRNNNIKNVFIVSGDAHTAGIDDGQHSGIPELMAANLRKANSKEALIFQNFIGHNLWNKGGSGFCMNDNFNNAYGKVEVFGRDSLKMSAVDENGFEIAKAVFYHDAPYKFNPNELPNKYPVANDDAAAVFNGRTNVVDVLANDTDPENDALFVMIEQQPASGTLIINNDQTLSYTPLTGYMGADSFLYRVCDFYYPGCPSCSQARVMLNVTEPTGIGYMDDGRFRVYPNPASAKLHVEAAETGKQYEFVLMNPVGKEAMRSVFRGKKEFDLTALPAGLYLYLIFSADNGLLRKGKLDIVKE